MANLKARMDNLIKSASHLISVLPADYFKTPRLDLKPDDFPLLFPDDVLEVKKMLKLIKDQEKGHEVWYYRSKAEILVKTLTNSDLLKDKKIADKFVNFKKNYDYYYLGYYPKKRERQPTKSKPILPDSERSTEDLVGEYKSLTQSSYSEDRNDKRIKDLKEILNTRGHINNVSQKRLIKRMSIHAGEKLTLRDAQLLENNLKKKNKLK
jgi:hypothetical protein